MATYCEMDLECELEYEFAARAEREVHRLPRRYSPRFEKQKAPQGARGGVHRRGGKSEVAYQAA